MFIASHATTGSVSKRISLCRIGVRKKGPSPSRNTERGKARSSGTAGAPISSRGGATEISIRCCVIWATRNRPSKVSRGEATAIHIDNKPPRKHHARQGGKRSGRVRRISRQPRRESKAVASSPAVAQKGKAQELQAACDTPSDMTPTIVRVWPKSQAHIAL